MLRSSHISIQRTQKTRTILLERSVVQITLEVGILVLNLRHEFKYLRYTKRLFDAYRFPNLVSELSQKKQTKKKQKKQKQKKKTTSKLFWKHIRH